MLFLTSLSNERGKMNYCDLRCKHARFPDKLSDGSLTCRTFVGLYCERLKKVVTKNAPCEAEQTQMKRHNNADKN